MYKDFLKMSEHVLLALIPKFKKLEKKKNDENF